MPWLAEAELGEDAAQYLTYNGNPSESQVETMLRNADAWLDRLKPTTTMRNGRAKSALCV